MRKFLATLSLGLLVSSCSFFPKPEEPVKKYVIGTLPNIHQVKDCLSHSYQITVDLPTVYPPIDNTRIALKPQERTIDYYADVEWGDRLSALIQESLIYSLQNAGKFRAVSRPTEGIQAEYTLKVEVRKFYIEQPDNPRARSAQVDYMVYLVALPMHHIIASHNFIHHQAIPELTMDTLVASLNDAHLQVIQSLIPWLMHCLSSHSYVALEKH